MYNARNLIELQIDFFALLLNPKKEGNFSFMTVRRRQRRMKRIKFSFDILQQKKMGTMICRTGRAKEKDQSLILSETLHVQLYLPASHL